MRVGTGSQPVQMAQEQLLALTDNVLPTRVAHNFSAEAPSSDSLHGDDIINASSQVALAERTPPKSRFAPRRVAEVEAGDSQQATISTNRRDAVALREFIYKVLEQSRRLCSELDSHERKLRRRCLCDSLWRRADLWLYTGKQMCDQR